MEACAGLRWLARLHAMFTIPRTVFISPWQIGDVVEEVSMHKFAPSLSLPSPLPHPFNTFVIDHPTGIAVIYLAKAALARFGIILNLELPLLPAT